MKMNKYLVGFIVGAVLSVALLVPGLVMTYMVIFGGHVSSDQAGAAGMAASIGVFALMLTCFAAGEL